MTILILFITFAVGWAVLADIANHDTNCGL